MQCTEPATLLPPAIALLIGVILVAVGLLETGRPVVDHPAHHRLPRRLVVGSSMIVGAVAATYLFVRGAFFPGLVVGTLVSGWAWFSADKLEKLLRADEAMTETQLVAVVKKAGPLSRRVRPFVLAVLSAIVLVGSQHL
jgi:hypothetical protein